MQNIPPSPSPPPLVTTPSSESSSSSSSSESEDNNAQINFFDHIPTEIRVAIFKDALKEPGLQFLGIFSYHPDGTTLSVRGPNQLCKEQEYPSGCFSVYRKREFISQTCRVARETYDIVCESFIRPQSFLVEVGPPMMSVTREAIYDKAIDVAYIKFGKWPLWTQQPSLRSAPPGWVQRAVEFYALEGIARIAIEVPRPVWRPCRYVPRTKSQARGSGRGCALCGLRHAEHVNASVKLELENYCRFLRRFSDIEEVLLVLCNPPHRLDFTPSQRQYIATGTPVVDGPVAAATEEKFANGKGLEFEPRRGTFLREVTNPGLLDSVFHIAASLQKIYVEKSRPKTPGRATPNQRMEVQFRLMMWESEDSHRAWPLANTRFEIVPNGN